MPQFDDIAIAIDRFRNALKDFVDDDGAAEIEITPKITDTVKYISEFFDAYEWNAHTNTFQKKGNEN